ncbi:hypothetical protein CC78DRAFT_584562 [Lojkania enalia]|uniref:Rhodopsin domain-containing protein n=1 Tax=Lojkania enalia TaxID=147567 RepID=A0A9P4K4E1_9PLEO|nr:hypothetical protein CC78DRAFT_584562 [Didymosphaeria enalia]
MLDGWGGIFERRHTAPIGDRGMIVSVVSWILLVVMVFILTTRFAMKFAMGQKGRRFGLDDIFILLAALASIGQTIAVSIESVHALGQHWSDLTQDQIRIFQKSEYVGCMLYIANFGCARISACLLIKKILAGNLVKYTALVFIAFTTIWTISGVFVTAFPCHLPRPWDFQNNKCYNLVQFVNYVGITNIVVEVILVLIPLFVWNIRLEAGRRVSVSFAFLSRLSIVAAVAAQLTFFNRYSSSWDFTYVYWRTVLCVQIAQNLSVITACVPCLHPFILRIISGAEKTDGRILECLERCNFKDCFRKNRSKFNSMSSQASSLPIKEDYCRPLETHGLDRSSSRLNFQHIRIPSNVATPITDPNPPENFFNRIVEIPRSRPQTAGSQKDLPPIPKTLSQVGILPVPEFDIESSDGDSARSSPRKRDSGYVFKREKVMSVTRASKFCEEQEEQYWRKYPPPPSPRR